MKTGIEIIAEERRRQVEVEGFTAEHDDEHNDGAMAMAAACYATPELLYKRRDYANSTEYNDPWPWDPQWDGRPHHGNVVQPNGPFYVNKPDRLRQLAKAGALIAAEIDRIQRLNERGE